jgi:hypothetical protein
MKRLHGGILSLLACLLVMSASGCMIGPTHGEHIGSIENKIRPGGFVLDGDMLIEVQAWNFEIKRWETVATTRSLKGSNAWDGYDWHYWQSPQIALDDEYWHIATFWVRGREGPIPMYAKLRALGDGGSIYTFKEWNLGPLSEMQQEVHGNELHIHGNLIRIL